MLVSCRMYDPCTPVARAELNKINKAPSLREKLDAFVACRNVLTTMLQHAQVGPADVA